MPKRVLDGEGIWRSDKLARVEPLRARPEYANVLALALANGSFECKARRVWSQVYSYNRPDVSPDDVQDFLQAFENVGLLFRWTEPDGKQWGYFPGIEKPGRLPGQSRMRKHEKIGAVPPAEQLRKFLESKNFPGFGSGLGSCIGTGPGSGEKHNAPKTGALRVPPRPSIFIEAREAAFRSYEARFGIEPAWDESDYSQLAALFKRVTSLTIDEFLRRWRNYVDSSEPFIQKQGLRLRYFSTNFDRFLKGPVHEGGNGNGNNADAARVENGRVAAQFCSRVDEVA